MTDSRDSAIHLLQHYFWVVADAAGVKRDNDMNVELSEIVDHILDASSERARAVAIALDTQRERAREPLSGPPRGRAWMTAEERYQRDPAFRQIVDVLLNLALSLSYTPTELREAAMLAAVKAESMRPPRPFLFERDPNG